MAPVIFTCFTGRRNYLEVLFVYVQKLLDKGYIDEFHMWDYTRDVEDTKFIRDFSMNDTRVHLMSVFSKSSWKEYYDFYTKQRYPDPMTVIVKCDDDILFIDVEHFPVFIMRRRDNPEFLLSTAMVMNNPVCNSIQLSMGMISSEYFSEETIGRLWYGKDTVKLIHKYFLELRHKLVPDSRGIDNIVPLDARDGAIRLNINFVAILGKDLDVFQAVEPTDDEGSLGQTLPIILRRYNYLDPSFIVVHSAYCKQREDGFDDTDFISKYKYIALH